MNPVPSTFQRRHHDRCRSLGRVLLLTGFSACMASQARFTHVVVDASPDRIVKPYIKLLGDINGDGFNDIVVASAKGNGVRWYAATDWTRHDIRSEGRYSEQACLADVDADGDPDLVIPDPHGIFWLANPLISGTQTGHPGTDAWEQHFIGSNGTNVHDLVVADLDGNGRLDVAARYEKEKRRPLTVWFQTEPLTWEAFAVSDHYGEGLAAGDVDADGDLDLLVNDVGFLNGGDGRHWRQFQFASGSPDQMKVVCADLDGDGRDEIIASPQSVVPEGRTARITCYFLVNSSNPLAWRTVVLEEGAGTVNKVHGLACADLDGDGDFDITTSKRHDARGTAEICIFTNIDGSGEVWEKSVIATSGSHNHVVGDIGGDGDPDILGANWADSSVVEIWLQE